MCSWLRPRTDPGAPVGPAALADPEVPAGRAVPEARADLAAPAARFASHG
ncbi:hypothetical protein MPRG_34560 [Mycobacterium paragordonae]|uniref:Uncharacterized protein n=1 Tax=Mycobacterium paragordonae TaxID=1389713 RepID=A0ABQ1C780_9MYCO|nr:hypothetical protein MPRG_34560 [Mycobacterium paragordonae]